jgi:hypothetical protein
LALTLLPSFPKSLSCPLYLWTPCPVHSGLSRRTGRPWPFSSPTQQLLTLPQSSVTGVRPLGTLEGTASRRRPASSRTRSQPSKPGLKEAREGSLPEVPSHLPLPPLPLPQPTLLKPPHLLVRNMLEMQVLSSLALPLPTHPVLTGVLIQEPPHT